MGLCRILLLPGPCAEVHGPSLKGIYTGIWVLMRLQVEISLSSSPLEVLIHPSCALKAPPQLASLASSGLSNPNPLARALRRRRREKVIKKARKVKKLEREAREKARKAALVVTHKGGMPAAKKADDSGDSDTDSEFGPEEDLGNEEVGDGEVQDQSDDEELPIIATLNDVEEEDNEEDEDNDEEDELEEAI